MPTTLSPDIATSAPLGADFDFYRMAGGPTLDQAYGGLAVEFAALPDCQLYRPYQEGQPPEASTQTARTRIIAGNEVCTKGRGVFETSVLLPALLDQATHDEIRTRVPSVAEPKDLAVRRFVVADRHGDKVLARAQYTPESLKVLLQERQDLWKALAIAVGVKPADLEGSKKTKPCLPLLKIPSRQMNQHHVYERVRPHTMNLGTVRLEPMTFPGANA